MGAYILFILLVILAMASLAVFFSLKAKEKYNEGKRGKFILALIGAVIAIGYIVFVLCRIFPLTIDGMIGYGSLGTMLGIVLTWMAAALINNKWRLAAVVLSPLFFIGFIVYLATSDVNTDLPMTKAEAQYSDMAEVSQVLGNVSLPAMEFKEAWQGPFDRSTFLGLKNEADSAQLSTIFQKLKEQQPLQIMESERTGRMYMHVDKKQNTFANVVFEPTGVKVFYGDISDLKSPYISQFDSINAPIPNYEMLTYMKEDFVNDWIITEKVEFAESIPMAWLDNIKLAAIDDKNWDLREHEDSYIIEYRDSRYPQYSLEIKLYKDLGGERKVADLRWGKY